MSCLLHRLALLLHRLHACVRACIRRGIWGDDEQTPTSKLSHVAGHTAVAAGAAHAPGRPARVYFFPCAARRRPPSCGPHARSPGKKGPAHDSTDYAIRVICSVNVVVRAVYDVGPQVLPSRIGITARGAVCITLPILATLSLSSSRLNHVNDNEANLRHLA
jgi:hypothetical protein